MAFALSAKSLKRLEGVHPELVAVVKRAIELTPVDFGVSEGVRTTSRQLQLVGQGKSMTENSKHLLQGSGYGHAVDIFAFVNGKANWTNRVYGPIVQAFFNAAVELGVQIKPGHLWPTFQDSVHIELDDRYY